MVYVVLFMSVANVPPIEHIVTPGIALPAAEYFAYLHGVRRVVHVFGQGPDD